MNNKDLTSFLLADQDQEIEFAKDWLRNRDNPERWNQQMLVLWDFCCTGDSNALLDVTKRFAMIGVRTVVMALTSADKVDEADEDGSEQE